MQDARLDLSRRQRLGIVEAVCGQHKDSAQIIDILQKLTDAGELSLVTRVSPDKAAAVQAVLPDLYFKPLWTSGHMAIGTCASSLFTAAGASVFFDSRAA